MVQTKIMKDIRPTCILMVIAGKFRSNRTNIESLWFSFVLRPVK